MNDKQLVNYDEEEYINLNYTQDLIDIEKSFKNDILYKMLKKANLTDKIITEEMKELMFLGRTYKTEEVAIMTNISEPILRNLLNGRDASHLPSYINAIKESKFYVLDCESIFRIRLIYLVQKELNYSIKQIAAIATGLEEPYSNRGRVIYSPEQINSFSDKLDKLELNNIELTNKCEQLSNQNILLLNFIQSICEKDSSGQLRLKVSEIPMLKENNKEIEEIKEKVNKMGEIQNNQEFVKKEVVDEQIQKLKTDFKIDIDTVKKNMLYRKAEYLALEKRSFTERLLNKTPSKETIDEIYKKLCESGE